MIRQLRAEDAEACSKLIRECIEQDSSLTPAARIDLARRISPKSVLEDARRFHVVVCEQDGVILGVGGLELNEIRLLFVAADFQRQGIGSTLLRHVESLVPPGLFREIFVYCSPMAVAFYRGHGYVPHGEHRFEMGHLSLPTMFLKKGI